MTYQSLIGYIQPGQTYNATKDGKGTVGVDPSELKDAYMAGDYGAVNKMIASTGMSEQGASRVLGNLGYDPNTALGEMKSRGVTFAASGTPQENTGWNANATGAGAGRPLIGGGTGGVATTGGGGGTDPGLVNQWYQKYQESHPTATQGYDAAQVTPTPWTVGANQTVSGQVNALIGAGSPLMDRAAAAADGEMNKRGLVNSSMGVQAAQNAVYDHALQIAMPDALTFRTAGQFNADAQNTAATNNASFTNNASQFTAGAANTGALADTSARTQTNTALIGAETSRYGTDSAWATANLNAETQKAVAGMNTASAQAIAATNAETSKYLGNLDATTKAEVAQFANDNQLLINTNQQAASIFQQAMVAISTIQNNPAMDSATKTQAVQSVFSMINSQYHTLSTVAGLNLPDLVDFTQGQTPVVPNATKVNPITGVAYSDGDGSAGGIGSNSNGDAAGVGAGPR